MLFRNFTPFPPLCFESRDENQNDFGVVVLRGSFKIESGKRLRLNQQQDPIVFVDEFYGDPQKSSLKTQASLIPFKPSTDVFVTANAYSPSFRAEPAWKAGIRFGEISKNLFVTGPRMWESRLGRMTITNPQPVVEVPVLYESAFGGCYQDKDGNRVAWPENPVGRGFIDKSKREPVLAPQIFATEQDARNLSYGTPCTTAGLGPVAPHWTPRSNHVGTYNEMWKRTRFPDLPSDFNFAFYSSASEGLTLPAFAKGTEKVELTNLTVERKTVFALPGFQLASLLRFESGAVIPSPVMLDTIDIDAIKMKVHLTWRTVYPVNAGLRALEIRAKDIHAKKKLEV